MAGLAGAGQDDVDMVVGNDEAARCRSRGDVDRNAAAAGVEDSGQVPLLGAHQFLIDDRLAWEDLKARHRAGKLIEREVFLKAIWEDNGFFVARSMDVFVSKLRKYIRHDRQLRIENIRGVGYVLKVGTSRF